MQKSHLHLNLQSSLYELELENIPVWPHLEVIRCQPFEEELGHI